MLAGILAGLLVFAFGTFIGEPPVNRAISFESTMEEARSKVADPHGMHAVEEPALVSRDVQSGLGLFTGVMIYATAFGGLFGLVFAVADRRIAVLGPRAISALLAAFGFVAVYVVPSLKYPASPPSVGQSDTIGQRTALYFIMLALSVAAMVGAVIIRKRLADRFGGWNAALIASGSYVMAVVAVASVLPAINEVPEAFPATVLWQFRQASLGMQFIMWATLGLAFGFLTERALLRSGSRRPRACSVL
jgi:predicted cobalt transporter CbtA